MEVSKNICSIKIRAGKNKTYYVDLKETDIGKIRVALTELRKSRSSFGNEVAPHHQKSRVFVDADDMSRVIKALETVYAEMKQRMPGHDFEKFDRRDAEYEKTDGGYEERGSTGNEQQE